jgi:hypothetical protein
MSTPRTTFVVKTTAWFSNPGDILDSLDPTKEVTVHLSTWDMADNGWIKIRDIEVFVTIPALGGLISAAAEQIEVARQKLLADTEVRLDAMSQKLLALTWEVPNARR